MKINNLGINFERYWNPNYEKNSLSLKENAKILSDSIEQSWNYF